MTGAGIATGQSIAVTGLAIAFLKDTGAPVTADVVCYRRGARILTPDGEVAIAALSKGDIVVTAASGNHLPVTWTGRRHVDCCGQAHPERVRPWLSGRMYLANGGRMATLFPELPGRVWEYRGWSGDRCGTGTFGRCSGESENRGLTGMADWLQAMQSAPVHNRFGGNRSGYRAKYAAVLKLANSMYAICASSNRQDSLLI